MIKRRLKREWQLHLMILPAIILMFIFHYIPLYGVVLAFQKYNPALGFSSPWVGLDNFKFLFSQPNFIRTIWNSFYMSIFKILLGIIVPVIVALLLNEIGNSFHKRLFQTIIYIPNFMSWVIVAGILMDVLGSKGILNRFLEAMNLQTVNFLGDPAVFPWTIIISDVWKGFGFGTVVYLATLTGIDPELYDSAKVDGANRWKQTIYITLPMMLPIIVLMTVLAVGNVLNAGFDQIYNMYSPVVYSSGDIIDTYVYRIGIENAKYSISTAAGLFKSVINAILLGMSYLLADKVAHYRVF